MTSEGNHSQEQENNLGLAKGDSAKLTPDTSFSDEIKECPICGSSEHIDGRCEQGEKTSEDYYDGTR